MAFVFVSLLVSKLSLGKGCLRCGICTNFSGGAFIRVQKTIETAGRIFIRKVRNLSAHFNPAVILKMTNIF